jgi:uncharacterized membrane protein
MNTEQTLSPQESLSLIAEAISRTKESFKENSFGFLLWGWLVSIASFAYFILLHYTSFEFFFIPFPILAIVGIVSTIVFLRKKNSERTVSYLTYYFNRMWAVLGLGFIVIVFVNVVQGRMPFTYTLIIAGVGTLISGLVMKFSPLVIGGILFLASSILSVYVIDDFKPLLHGIAIVAGYLVPGYLLKNSKI